MSDAREQADHVADRLRDDLLTTLKELDRRRHKATDLRYQLGQHQGTLLLVVGGAVVLVGALVGWSQVSRRRRYRLRFRHRWEGLRRAWAHPERLASRASEEPAAGRLAKKLLVAFGAAFGTRLARRAAVELVPTKPRRQPGEPYVH